MHHRYVRSLVGLLATTIFLSSSAFAQNGQPHVFPMSGTSVSTSVGASVNNQSATGNLINNGGPTLQNSTAYAILWGSSSAFPTDLRTALPLFFNGFGSSVYSNILDQYLPAPALSQFGATVLHDGSTPPAGSPAVSTIVNEACRAIKAGKVPLDPIDSVHSSGAVYFIFTSNFPSGINFCGGHSYGSCQGQNIAVSYIPNLKNVTGCNPGNLYSANTYSEGTRADVNVVAHELSEAITDPELNAWFDSVGNEIGDKCAWSFASAVTLANSTTWQLQQEWSNAAAGCIQQQSTP